MNGSLRNKIKRGACIACASLSLGGLNASKSNAMNGTGTTLKISGGSLGGVFLLGTFVKCVDKKIRESRKFSKRGHLLFILQTLYIITPKYSDYVDRLRDDLSSIIDLLDPKTPEKNTEDNKSEEDKFKNSEVNIMGDENTKQEQDKETKEFLQKIRSLQEQIPPPETKDIEKTDSTTVANVHKQLIIALSKYLNINGPKLEQYQLKYPKEYMEISGYSNLHMKLLGLLQK